MKWRPRSHSSVFTLLATAQHAEAAKVKRAIFRRCDELSKNPPLPTAPSMGERREGGARELILCTYVREVEPTVAPHSRPRSYSQSVHYQIYLQYALSFCGAAGGSGACMAGLLLCRTCAFHLFATLPPAFAEHGAR